MKTRVLLIFFVLLSSDLSFAFNKGTDTFLETYPWVKDASEYRQDCFDAKKDVDYFSIIWKYCKVYSKKTSKTRPMLICGGGGLSPTIFAFESKEECMKK